MNKIQAIARTVIRTCFLTTAGVSFILIVSALLLILIMTADPPQEDQIFTAKILKAFEGKKEIVAVKDIFLDDWDYVCMNREYTQADKSIRMDLKFSEADNLRIYPENIYFLENETALLFVKKLSQNNYKAEIHVYDHSSANGLPLRSYTIDSGGCIDRDSAYLQLSFTEKNPANPSLIFIDKGSYND